MMLNVATEFDEVARNTTTLSVVAARMKDTVNEEKNAPRMSGISISRKMRMLPAPRLLAASPNDGDIWLNAASPDW